VLRWRKPSGPPHELLQAPWRSVEYCVLDFETTGLDLRRDEIVSFGAVVVADGRVVVGSAVYRVVRPGRPMSPGAVETHGILPSQLVNAPALKTCVDELLTIVGDRVLVAHAAWIEEAFLGRAARLAGRRWRGTSVDTTRLAAAAGLRSTTPGHVIALERLAALLGLPAHTPHHALGDALTTAEAFLALGSRLERAGLLTVGDLISAC
jgi:DNA polymerase III subunit epsilon